MNLATALRLAAEAHAGQLDKVGRPVILHPLRVMLALEPHGEDAMVVGVLHDVLEDTHVGAIMVRARGLTPTQEAALLAVTRARKGTPNRETYRAFIYRAAANPLGRLVKIADIKDNLMRCQELSVGEAVGMTRRYRDALRVLGADLT